MSFPLFSSCFNLGQALISCDYRNCRTVISWPPVWKSCFPCLPITASINFLNSLENLPCHYIIWNIGNYTSFGDRFPVYTNIKPLLCTAETKIMLDINYISIKIYNLNVLWFIQCTRGLLPLYFWFSYFFYLPDPFNYCLHGLHYKIQTPLYIFVGFSCSEYLFL